MKKNRNQSTDAAELRRYAEETLSASEIWYRRLFETAQDGILILDAETGMVVDMNPFLIEMLGYSHEAFLGKKVWELGFFKDIVANQDNFAELQQKGYIRYGDMPLETSDGRQIEVEFVSNLYLVNHQKVIQCNIRDITGRKQAEEKIRRLATVVRDSSDAITIQDFEGRITAWNRGAELMYGYSEAEALLANIERLTAPGKVEEQKEFTRRLMAGEAITAFETQRLTKDGRVLDVWLTVTKLMDAAGKPVGIASTERDITALKRAEEKLRETNDYLENLINHANAPIIVWDPQFRITRFNGAFESLTGRRADEVIGRPIEILFPPALAESSMELIAKTQTGERWETVEIHIQHIDGTRRTVLWNSATLFAPDGKTAVATIAQGMDITERNQVAEKMRRMATVVRDSNDAITISDFSGQITAWNHGAEQMYGYSEAEALQMSIWRITPAAKIAEKKAFIARLMAGEAITAFETQRLTKDGRVLDVWLTVTKLTDDAGKPVGIASTERDITARKRAHAALEQSERNFHNILQGSPDGMVIVDSNGLIIFANAAAADVFGRPREQLLGTSFDQPIILGQNTELAGVNPAKKNMVVEMRMIQTLWQENPACLVSLRDITHRKHNEQQLRLAGTELRRVNQNLVTRNAEIQNFYHTLSHELKTPLTSAREFVSIVMDGLAGPLTETQLEYLGIAKESCDQLRRYINDMLDVTRLETGKLSIEFQVVPLAALVERVVEMLAPAAAGKGISLSCDCQPDLPAVPLDQQRILQALTNLTTNAIKFTPAGGKIHLSLNQAPTDPKCLQVAVRDTGRGIPKDQLDMIFNRLYQVTGDDQSAESPHGLGLGLYICQELVQLHGGRIWAESEPGRGSTFTFTIPKCQTPASLDVLVVDDEAAIRDPLCQLFEKNGYHVALAGGGAEALQLMRQRLPALVILDLQMPDMDGAETLEHIRKEWGEIPVIIHTSHPAGDLMNRALKCAPFTVLAKPDTSEHILNVVHNLVRWDHKTAGETKASRLPEREGLRLRPVNTPSYNLQLEP